MRSARTGRARTASGIGGDLAEALEAVLRPETTSVWLAERERLARAFGRPPEVIEQWVRAVAAHHDLGMCGFTTSDSLGKIDAYDEVRDGPPVSTRRPSTPGSEVARDRP